MQEEIKSTVEKLVNNYGQYVIDAVVDNAVRDQNMADNGGDQLYRESARRLREIERKLKSGDPLSNSDIEKIVESILRYELHHRQ